jgi:hypothetical protein
MKKIKNILVVGCFLVLGMAQAQIGLGTTSPEASSILELKSDNKGLLLPRLTTDQRGFISNPAKGLMIFNTDSGALEVFIGGVSTTTWVGITGATGERGPTGDMGPMGTISTVTEGASNSALGANALAAGGTTLKSDGARSSTMGGSTNWAYGADSSVIGGTWSKSTGANSNIMGGSYNESVGVDASVIGGTINFAIGTESAVIGGSHNTAGEYPAKGTNAIVAGGTYNTASADNSSIVGGTKNTASGPKSCVVGGTTNLAEASETCVVGGSTNRAVGADSSVIGGLTNIALGTNSGVIGGNTNQANGINSSVIGGNINIASGAASTVSGGIGNEAPSFGEWVGGIYGTLYTPLDATGYMLGDRIFNIGNGIGPIATARKDAFTILKNGLATLPSVDIDLIAANTTTGTAIVTKEYINKYCAQFKTTAPDSPAAPGNVGEIRITAAYIYTCTATNTWKRSDVGTTWTTP